jgi:hypothetical protein
MHMVPQGWILPSTNIMDTWRLWYFGNVAEKIQPYRFLKNNGLTSEAQGVLCSTMKYVIHAIVEVMVEKQLVVTAGMSSP